MTAPVVAFAYVSGTSIVHRTNPVPKLVLLGGSLAFALATWQPIPLLGLSGVGLLLAAAAGTVKPVARAIGVLAPISASILVLQVLAPAACAPTCIEVGRIGPIAIGAEALARSLSLASRLLAMELVGAVVLATTHPSDLFAGLRRLHVPYTAALMLALTMLLVPAMARELDVVVAARRARGLRATGLAALVPATVPVFVATFERMQRLAITMEVRGLGRPGPRTSYRRVESGRWDQLLSVALLLLAIGGSAMGVAVWGPASIGPLMVPGWAAVGLVLAAAANLGWVAARAATAGRRSRSSR